MWALPLSLILCAFLVRHAHSIPNSTWSLVTAPSQSRWSRRHSHALFQFPSGSVWLIGGSAAPSLLGFSASGDPSLQLSDSFTAGPDLSSWSRLSTSPPPWRGRAGYAAAARVQPPLVLLTGGLQAPAPGASPLNAILCNDVWRTDDGMRWAQLPGNWGNVTRFQPRHGHAALFDGEAFFVLGGFVGATVGDAAAAADVWQSRMVDASPGENWTAVPQAKDGGYQPRAFFAAAFFSGALFVAGGSSGLGGPLRDDVVRSTNGGVAWAPVVTLPVGRAGAALMAGPPGALGALWLMGGQTSPLTLPGEEGSAAPAALACDTWRSDADGLGWALVEADGAVGCKAGAAAVVARGAGGGSASGPALLGGLVQRSAGGAVLACSETWASTTNLLCEEGGLVCGGRGSCPNAVAPKVTQPFAHRHLFTPFNVSCVCDAPFAGENCAACDPAACVHGACAPLNASAPGGPAACACNDTLSWRGPTCATAVCAPGCSSEHGSCSGAPGTCICAPGWAGPACNDAEGLAVALARAITDNPRAAFLTTALVGLLAAQALSVWANAPGNWLLGAPKGDAGSCSGGGKDAGQNGSARKVAFSLRRPVFGRSYLRTRFGGGGGGSVDDEAGAERAPLLVGGASGKDAPPFPSDAPLPPPANFASRHGEAVLLSPYRAPGAPSSVVGAGARSEGGVPPLSALSGELPSAKLVLSQAASGASPPPKAHVRFAERLAHFDDDADKPQAPFY